MSGRPAPKWRGSPARVAAIAAVLGCAGGPTCPAAPPAPEALFPAGIQRGTETTVIAVGQVDPWPAAAWTDSASLTFIPHPEEKGRFTVRADGELLPGPHLVRIFNSDGASPPRIFLVGDHAEFDESEPNGDLAAPQRIETNGAPITINGRLEQNGDVDCFAVDLAEGQFLTAEATAYAIDSPVDLVLHLRDANGAQLAFNHDGTATGLDPRLEFRAPSAGTYTLQLAGFAHPPQANVRFTGSASTVYRLTLHHDPAPPRLLPPPVEREPNNESRDATSIAIPSSIGGRIEPPGDIDRFSFQAAKDQTFRFEVLAARLGFLTDPLLAIETTDGRELASHDDIDKQALHDAALDWTAPEDGMFLLAVSEVSANGGADFGYRIRATLPGPEITATSDGHTWALKAGESLDIKLAVTRARGHTGDWIAFAEGLPPGVTASPVPLPAESGEATIRLEASADPPPANQPFALWIAPAESPARRLPVMASLAGAATDAGDLLINRTASLWLTVVPPAPSAEPPPDSPAAAE